VFLVMLAVTGVLFTMRKGPAITTSELGTILLDFLLVPAAIGTLVVFTLLITRTNPETLILKVISLVARREVSFITAVPQELENTLEARIVDRQDTDGDGFDEWIVFYEYDLQSGANPVEVVIYDNDRGRPPVIYPYGLKAPNNAYLGETAESTSLSLRDVTNTMVNGQNLPEIVVKGTGRMGIFRYDPANKGLIAPPDMPSDNPPRYVPIGFFTGNGGVSINDTTKDVTVVQRNSDARSQLSVRSIYALDPDTRTYWAGFNAQTLAAPIMQTVDFFSDPPDDIVNTTYPENIVLAFYASTCAGQDKSLCLHYKPGLVPAQFQYPGADASNAFADYFGLSSLNSVHNLEVKRLEYISADKSTCAEELSEVQIEFTESGSSIVKNIGYCMKQNWDGQWKIYARNPINQTSTGSLSPEISTIQ
jgi:hypothetical protein